MTHQVAGDPGVDTSVGVDAAAWLIGDRACKAPRRTGVTVNSVSPGFIRTEWVDGGASQAVN